MRLKILVPILACLLTLSMVVPVQATSYTVTLTLKKDVETVWTGVLEVEVPDSILNLTVTQTLYDWIVAYFGNDTLEMPFEAPLDPSPIPDPPYPRIIVYTLRVESNPPGLIIVFHPMPPGDVDGDGRVGIIDIVIVALHFGGTPETSNYNLLLDLNLDFKINIVDLVTVAIGFGATY